MTVNLATGTATDGYGDSDTLSNIENVTGTKFADTITGDDVLMGGLGSDTLYGGDGIDTAEFAGNLADYTITIDGRTVTVASVSDTDFLSGIEFLAFADQTTAAPVNEAPVITSNGGEGTASLSVSENTTAVTTVVASDPESDTVTFSIIGGADAGKFAIDADLGALTFTVAPDFEAPGDVGGDNGYEVTVQASDGNGGLDSQTLTVSVTDVNEAPAIVSHGGGDTASLSVAENTTAVTTVTASDPENDAVTFAIAGGADAGKFAIDADLGTLTFNAAPDFEAPGDDGGDNSYEVIVEASDGNGGLDSQTLTVDVTNVNEAPAITSDGGGDSASLSVAENTTAVTTVTASDPENDAVTFAIAGGADAGLFAIDADLGTLTFNAAPDFEAPGDDGGDNSYEVDRRGGATATAAWIPRPSRWP